jgi:protease II
VIIREFPGFIRSWALLSLFRNRVLMMGYGAYGESLDLHFEARNYPLLKSGTILALCHVR